MRFTPPAVRLRSITLIHGGDHPPWHGTWKYSGMTIENDAANTPAPMDSRGTDNSIEVSRGWDHIGAIIVDATLQRRQNYNETVKPRVEALVAEWPDAATTSGFRRQLDTGKLSEVIDWPSPGRLAQIADITKVFEREGIETVTELRGTLEDHAKGAALREALALVRHVSPKTLDYIGTLSGISTGVDVD
ncbi:UNVERIFIED_ORG: hypothetical protein ABIB52_003212 [Arthrobacter sp. UYCu721]